jgi:hypothetical protein
MLPGDKIVQRVVLYALGALVLGGLLYSGASLGLFKPLTKLSELTGQKPPTQNLGGFSGSMTFTGITRDGSNFSGIYALSGKDGSIKLEKSDNYYYAPAFSGDGRVAVVANDGEGGSSLFISPVASPKDATRVIPPAPALWAGKSAWSPDNRYLVYDASAAFPGSDSWDIKYFRVIVLDTKTGVQRIIDTGVSPAFSGANTIMFLKPDGVYEVALDEAMKTVSTEVILPLVDLIADPSSRMSISPDKRLFALSFPNEQWLGVYKRNMTAERGIVLEQVLGQNGLVLWSVFSPDSASLAYIELNEDMNMGGMEMGSTSGGESEEDEAMEATLHLMIRPLTTSEPARVVADLSEFEWERYLSLTRWSE